MEPLSIRCCYVVYVYFPTHRIKGVRADILIGTAVSTVKLVFLKSSSDTQTTQELVFSAEQSTFLST